MDRCVLHSTRNNTNECEHVSLTLSAEPVSRPEARGWTRGVHGMACPAVLVFPGLPSAVSLFQLSFVSVGIDKTNMNNHLYILFGNLNNSYTKNYIYQSKATTSHPNMSYITINPFLYYTKYIILRD